MTTPPDPCIENAIRMICEAFPDTTIIHDHFDQHDEQIPLAESHESETEAA